MKKGFILPLLLVVTTLVLSFATSLAGLVGGEYRTRRRLAAGEQAFWNAQAGLEATRWQIDLSPDLALTASSINRTHTDAFGATIGTSQTTITPDSDGCKVGGSVRAAGDSASPRAHRVLIETQQKINIAEYAFTSNAPLWIGKNVSITANIHSNTGLRVDGKIKGTASATPATYACTADIGCTTPTTKPGVWGTGSKEEEFPTAPVDFATMIPDYAALRTLAQASGTYLGTSGGKGWHLTFQNDGSIKTAVVNQLENTACAYDGGSQATASCKEGANMAGLGWFLDATEIKKETAATSLTLPTDNGQCDVRQVVFIEDHAWIEGMIPRRATVVVGRVPDSPGNRPMLIIPQDITSNGDGQRPLLESQGDIRLGMNVPNDLSIDALIVSPTGRIIRPRYAANNNARNKNKLKLTGTATAPFVRWSWYDSSNDSLLSGFASEDIKTDKSLIDTPPPWTPVLAPSQSRNWHELPEPLP